MNSSTDRPATPEGFPPQSPSPNGTVTSTSHTGYSEADLARLTAAGVILTWEDLTDEDRLEIILTTCNPAAWFADNYLEALTAFRRIPVAWGRIKAVFTQYRGNAWDLEKAVDMRRKLDLAATAVPPPATPAHEELLVIEAATLTPEKVSYEWDPYLPLQMVTIMDGDPGVGKTGIACLIATATSRGWSLPDQTGKPSPTGRPPANVVMVAMEDHLNKLIIPRLLACQADLARIAFVNEIKTTTGELRPFTLADLPLLTAYVARVRPRFVCIDSIQAVLGPKVDINRANQVTAILSPLKKLAEQYNCAILCSRHPSKPGQHVAKVLYRGMGSQAFVGTVRSGLFVEQHPDDETKALMVHYKSNTSGLGWTQIFSKAEGHFAWCGASRITHSMLAGYGGPGPLPTERLKVCLWLEEKLKDGAGHPASGLYKEAEETRDWSQKVVRSASEYLKVTKRQILSDFLWYLPPLQEKRERSGGSGGSRGSEGSGGSGVDWQIQGERHFLSSASQAAQDTQDTPDPPVLTPPLEDTCGGTGVDMILSSLETEARTVDGQGGARAGPRAPCLHQWRQREGQATCARCGDTVPSVHPTEEEMPPWTMSHW